MVMVQRTTLPTPDILQRQWHVVDATGQHLGRLATEVANLLRGKHKPYFVTFQDTGDFVIVINAEKVVVTGKKATQKFYRRTSGRPGGMKFEMYSDLQKRIPERILEKAIGGMLPHTRLGRQQYTKLHVYKGPNHPHHAQQPAVYTLGGF